MSVSSRYFYTDNLLHHHNIIIIIIIITMTMFMVLSSWHSHCESSPGSFDECRHTNLYIYILDAVLPIHIVSNHVASNKNTTIISMAPQVKSSQWCWQTQAPMSLYVRIIPETLLQLLKNFQCHTQIDLQYWQRWQCNHI